MSTTSKA